MNDIYKSKSLRIEKEPAKEIIEIGGKTGYKSPKELLEMSEYIHVVLNNMITGIDEQFRMWDFAGHTDKTLLNLMEGVKDICRLGMDEQEDAQTKLKVIMDLLK